MKDLVDILFRFPNKPEAGPVFVTSVLSLFTIPAMVVDRKLKVHLVNVHGQDVLFGFDADYKRAKSPDNRRANRTILPLSLKDPIRSCIKDGRAVVMSDFPAPGVRGDRYDLVLCPGEIRGAKFCFILMLRPFAEPVYDPHSVLCGLLESINGCAVYLDTEGRFQEFNRRYLEVFGLRPEEVRGIRVSELNPSKQAGILENQIKHLMAAGEVRTSASDTLTTAKRGVLITSILAWPLTDQAGECQGLLATIQPAPKPAPLSLMDEKARELFGTTAIEHGPPMVFTHVDGKIIAMNLAAQRLLRNGKAEEAHDIKSAFPWDRPELIDQLYNDLLGGLKFSLLHTHVDTPMGRRIFTVQAVGLKEIGDITSIVLIHFQDVTEIENSRTTLAQTARRLATDKEILHRVVDRLQNLRIAYAVVDRQLKLLRASESAARRFGKAPAEVMGRKIDEIAPQLRTTGIIAYIKTAMERGRSISVPSIDFEYAGGERAVLSFDFYPMTVDGKEACLVVSENLTERAAHTDSLGRQSRRLQALLDNLEEGIAILDRNGRVLDVNQVISSGLRMKREELVGRPEQDLIVVEEGDLLVDFRRRALLTRQPVSTGCIKLTSKQGEGSFFAEISFIPLLDSEGVAQETVEVVRFLTEVVNLEKQIEEYTANLERLVRERTSELTSANQELETTVGKLASMAQSGLVLSSLKDVDSVMGAFLEEAQDVMAADFVSVAVITSVGGSYKTTYYSRGRMPPPGAVPMEVMEKGLASLSLDEGRPPIELPARENLLIEDFSFSDMRGLLMAWKEEGRFSHIDGNLSRLLCTQLGFAVPITKYVTDLRNERDRSRCLRRIAYRTAGSSSVSSAIGIVAEELSKVIDADRFFWFVSKDGGDIWLSEVMTSPRVGVDGRKHLGGEDAAAFAPILEAWRDSQTMFCDRFPRLGGEGFVPEGAAPPGGYCSFADPAARGELVGCLKDLLKDQVLISKDEGALAVAPVMLSPKSCGLLCAYNEMGVPFGGHESCFMCQAASTVGHMWQAADASSSMRRLEAEGETLGEIAHDLKYPLMRVREILERVGKVGAARAEDAAAIKEIDSEINTLNLLAEELIDISNRKGRHPEIVDVCEVIDRCISLTERDAAGRSVRVRKEVDSTPPPVFVNKKDLKDILINVVANCVEAAGRNGWVNIRVVQRGSGPDAGRVGVFVTDSGPGVAPDLLDRVFDAFYTTKPRGRGIGLFSAKKRANANGGDLHCEIGEDGRSRFVVSLPLAS